VLMREVEAALDALHETQDRPHRKCNEQ